MDDLEDQLAKLNTLNSKPMATSYTNTSHTNSRNVCIDETIVGKSGTGKVAALVSNLEDCNLSIPTTNISNNGTGTGAVAVANTKCLGQRTISPKKVPQSSQVKQVCEPLYSQRLQCLDNIPANNKKNIKLNSSSLMPGRLAILQRKQPIYATQNSLYYKTSKVTLDNPAILEQQLEALAHHKKQLERKGLLSPHQDGQKQENPHSRLSSCVPKLSSISLINDVRPINENSNVIYTNLRKEIDVGFNNENVQSDKRLQYNEAQIMNVLPSAARNNIYSNVLYENDASDHLLPQTPAVFSIAEIGDSEYLNNTGAVNDDEVPPPPSPVSSSYSELRRATDVSDKKQNSTKSKDCNETVSNNCCPHHHYDENEKTKFARSRQTYMNMNYSNNGYSSYSPNLQHDNDTLIYKNKQSISQDSSDYYGYGSLSQASSTYESIYEPINPRPPSQLSSRSNYLMYASYMEQKIMESGSGGMLCNIDNSSTNISLLGMHTSGPNIAIYPSGDSSNGKIHRNNQKENEVESLTDFLVHSMDTANDVDNYGICFKCNERVLGENSGCTAMDQIYHIDCFTCSQCQINLQGQPFYALENKPFCEYDYLQTLEKCSVCMKPILERILRATGKPYHPQCFTCIVCSNSLDGIPFTVDATNQNYCIADFHKKFAPRCCVCKQPIMPEPGEEETVRVVALDRSFHFECYKCEDCGLLLSSEAEGRGCYPLDDHVLCKSCNAKRVQMLTNRMITDL